MGTTSNDWNERATKTWPVATSGAMFVVVLLLAGTALARTSYLSVTNGSGKTCVLEAYKIGPDYIQPGERTPLAIIANGETERIPLPSTYHEVNAYCGPCMSSFTVPLNIQPPGSTISESLAHCAHRGQNREAVAVTARALLTKLTSTYQSRYWKDFKRYILDTADLVLLTVPHSAPIKPLFTGRPEDALPPGLNVVVDPTASRVTLTVGKKYRVAY